MSYNETSLWAAIRLAQSRLQIYAEDAAAAESLVRVARPKKAAGKSKAKVRLEKYVHAMHFQYIQCSSMVIPNYHEACNDKIAQAKAKAEAVPPSEI